MREDDGTNPLGTEGMFLHDGWPLSFPGNVRYWEYATVLGMVKRVHVDTDGDGEVYEDAPAPAGFTNPIVSEPYQDIADIPTLEDFGYWGLLARRRALHFP